MVEKIRHQGKYLTVNGNKVFWTKKKHANNSFTKTQIIQMTSYLIEECYFTIGNLLLSQSIGIPMGIDPAPFWANLYLHHYEYKFISKLIKEDKKRAFNFRHCFRFIDDECNINDSNEFSNSFQQIYPKELALKCEHYGTHASFLDLDISIVDGMFEYKLYDKRDDYPFHIVRMPDYTANIPAYVFYGSIMSEFLRISRCTLHFEDFLPRAKQLVSRMLKQGAIIRKIKTQFRKAINKHLDAFDSFNIDTEEIINNIFD